MERAEAIDAIVEGISEGTPLRELCRNMGLNFRHVYRWMEEDKDFAGRFARARVIGFDAIAEDCMNIADDSRNDFVDKLGADGEVVGRTLDAEHVQRSKLRIETRLKLLAKWDPKRYGDKIDMNIDATVKGSVAYKANIPTRKP